MAEKKVAGEEPIDDDLDIGGPPTASGRKHTAKGKDDARRAVRKQKEREEQEKVEEVKQDAEEWGYTLRCPSCSRDGIFFVRNPFMFGMDPGNWYSTYKDIDQYYPLNEVICQHCGSKLRLNLYPNGKAWPYPRFVMRYPREQFDLMMNGLKPQGRESVVAVEREKATQKRRAKQAASKES
jgi:hypothetical protein